MNTTEQESIDTLVKVPEYLEFELAPSIPEGAKTVETLPGVTMQVGSFAKVVKDWLKAQNPTATNKEIKRKYDQFVSDKQGTLDSMIGEMNRRGWKQELYRVDAKGNVFIKRTKPSEGDSAFYQLQVSVAKWMKAHPTCSAAELYTFQQEESLRLRSESAAK